MALAANFAITLNFIDEYGLSKVPLTDPSLFVGLFFGAMLIYSFGAVVLLAIQNVTPVLCLDMRAQIEESPGIL
jgi:Na+/H+-translocating membrane pyrophosphatase